MAKYDKDFYGVVLVKDNIPYVELKYFENLKTITKELEELIKDVDNDLIYLLNRGDSFPKARRFLEDMREKITRKILNNK